jgi:hypothetical protein
MCVNLIIGGLVLLVIVLISGLCHLKDKNHVRLLLALVLVIVLIMFNKQCSKENFQNLIDENIMLGGGSLLDRQQEETSRDLDTLDAQIQLMKTIYLSNINKATVENKPSVQLVCTPPTAYFDSSARSAVSEIENSFSLEDTGLTLNQLERLINSTNNITN